jgi:hypothetical protein
MFAMSFGDFFLNGIIIGGVMLFCLSKIFTAVDQDGEIKKRAKLGVLRWLEKKFPEK